MYLRRLALLLAIAVGCADNTPTVCVADLRPIIAPQDTVIGVGDQFGLRVSILGCGGTKVLTDTLTFASSDLNVAVVGTQTGTVIAARPGTAVISVSGRKYSLLGTARLTVR